jgi:transposase
VTVKEVPSDIKEVQVFLSQLKGTKILCIEETTPSQWLFVELRDFVDDLIVCDPFRNKLLSDGPKTDKIDAIKLVTLLEAGLLKPVFHTKDELMKLRKLARGYENTIKHGVRLKNQRAAILRGIGHDREDEYPKNTVESFIIEGIDQALKVYESERERYEAEFRKLALKLPELKHLMSIPGIGLIGAVQVLAAVIDPKRFPDRSHWLSYCGLVKHDRISGGRSYGKRTPRHNRMLKRVFKTAAISSLCDHSSLYAKNNGDKAGALKRYYSGLLEKNVASYNARHAVARRVAVLALGVLKSGKKFDDRWREYDLKKQTDVAI